MKSLCAEWLETYFDEVEAFDFYRGIFPSGELEQKGEYQQGKYCGIAVEVTHEKKQNGKPKIKRYSITDDLEVVGELQKSDNFCLCSPISYAGKERTADHARFLYAVAVDLDRIQMNHDTASGLASLWNGHIIETERVPKPTYIVSSGTGVHLYYVLDTPVPLFQNIAKQLQALKHELTNMIWHGTVVDIKHRNEVQQEGIYQGFRMVGTITKNGSRARAFLTGDKVTLEYLNGFVSEGSRVTEYVPRKGVTLARAKELYPEWYEARITKKQPKNVWHVSRNVYDWWKREILEKASVGHRYWCLMILSVFAYKCSMHDEKHNPNPVTREELERDCFEIMKYFETLTNDELNHFDEGDVQDALEAYDSRWIKYPRDTIEYRCGFTLPHNKRNNRTQELHLQIARASKTILKTAGAMKPEGRPCKAEKVQSWQQANPSGNKAGCVRDTGLDRKTVSKYWNG